MILQSIAQINTASRSKTMVIAELIGRQLTIEYQRRKDKAKRQTISATLTATHFFVRKLLHNLYGVETRVPDSIDRLPKGRYLIVANHQERVDPYLILSTLPTKGLRTVLPIRTFTAHIYMRRWWQHFFTRPFGCFIATSTPGKLSGVRGGLKLSDTGQSLFIFPQGKRSSGYGDLKPGVGYLAQRRLFTILPVHINHLQETGRKTTQIRWGDPFAVNPDDRRKDIAELTSLIFDQVICLEHGSK